MRTTKERVDCPMGCKEANGDPVKVVVGNVCPACNVSAPSGTREALKARRINGGRGISRTHHLRTIQPSSSPRLP